MKFHHSKEGIDIVDVYIEKIVVCEKFAYGKNKEADVKYFTGHNIDKKQTIIHQVSTNDKMSQKIEKTQYISFVIKGKKLLERQESTWIKISNIKTKLKIDKLPVFVLKC